LGEGGGGGGGSLSTENKGGEGFVQGWRVILSLSPALAVKKRNSSKKEEGGERGRGREESWSIRFDLELKKRI
jgi:hypothetical protein